MYKTIVYPANSYIVWDLETDGFDGNSNHVLEIGLFNVYNGEVLDKKRWVLNFNIDIPQNITDINGMTKAIIDEEGIDPKQALLEFKEFVMSSDANITHNGIRFDIPFIVAQLRLYSGLSKEEVDKIEKHLEDTAIDTATMFRSKIVTCPRLWNETFHKWAKRLMEIRAFGKYNLGVCCDELAIDRTKVTQHRALGDVELTNEVYKILIK